MAITEVTGIVSAKKIIADKLTTDFKNELEVTTLNSGRIEDYQTDHATGALIIHYDGSAYGKSKSQTIILQDRDLRIAIFMQIRIEKGLDYRDGLIDRVISSIAGLKIKTNSRFDRTYIKADDYLASEKDESKKFYEHSLVCIVPGEFKQADANIY